MLPEALRLYPWCLRWVWGFGMWEWCVRGLVVSESMGFATAVLHVALRLHPSAAVVVPGLLQGCAVFKTHADRTTQRNRVSCARSRRHTSTGCVRAVLVPCHPHSFPFLL